MEYKLLKDLPWLDKGNTVYQEDISDMKLKIKQLENRIDPWFKVWKSDWIEVSKLNKWLNMIISNTIENKEWFKKINK